MSVGGTPLIGAVTDAIDELLKRSGQVPKIGAGTSQPPPANPAPSRFGASALTAPPAQPELPQTHAVGAPGGTAPFMPAKIGASQPAVPSSPKIGAAMDTYDPSRSPMVATQPDYAAQYAAVQDPTRPAPDAGKPSMLRKIGGIALGAGIGAFNPQAGAQIGSSIVNGPRNELMRDYNQQELAANQQRDRISKEAGLADTGSQIQQRQAQAAKDTADAANVGQPKTAPAEVGHTYVDDKGNEVAVMKDGSTKVLGPAQQKPDKPDTANQDKQRYEGILQNQSLGKPVSAEDAAWAKAYQKASTLGPAATATFNAPDKSSARSDKSFQYNQSSLDKVRAPVDALAQRFSRLQDTLAQKSPQADALVAPELLSVMAGGVGSGVRMNEAEIARIVGGRSQWESLKAAMQKWSTNPEAARSITADQDAQIQRLIGAVGQKVTAKQKALEDAQNRLLDTDDPKEHRRIVADARKSLDDIDAGKAGGGAQAPAGASDEVYAKDGTTLIGHVVGGKYVPLQK